MHSIARDKHLILMHVIVEKYHDRSINRSSLGSLKRYSYSETRKKKTVHRQNMDGSTSKRLTKSKWIEEVGG